VILHCAPSQFAARAGAGILASLIDAGGIVEAFRIIGAFRSAIRRTADIVEQTRTRRMRADHLALRVRATWIR